MPFSEEYLKDYENKIQKLPVDELYEILDTIRDHPLKADDSPERVQIVEKRIIELTGDKDSILPLLTILRDWFRSSSVIMSTIREARFG